jgi:hypothetical protein
LAATLKDAGPHAQMWCPVGGDGSAFYARRFAHETAMHRADAALALAQQYTLDPDVAADAVDEWMELGCMPFHLAARPDRGHHRVAARRRACGGADHRTSG